MYRVTGDKDAVEELLEETATLFNNAASSSTARAAGISAGDQVGFQGIAEALYEAQDRLRNNNTKRAGAAGAGLAQAPMQNRAPRTPYAPRDQHIALFQSAMDEYLASVGASQAGRTPPKSSHGSASATGLGQSGPRTPGLTPFYKPGGGSQPPGSARAADLLAQFGPLDPRWAEVVIEQMKVLIKGKHKFVQPSDSSKVEFALDEKSTIAIVGDWGGGNEAAQAVARQIAKLKPKHVIHLGDVYYAGTPKEIEERFLKYWPTPGTPGRSFALNSNHEMYSGGYGYFDLTLPRFQQPASYFALSNSHWRFIGLDSGYDEHDLHAPQAEWLRSQVAREGPKNVLLTHHQLFSAYESADTSKLEAKVSAVLPDVFGWIWGHEHLCVVYEKHMGIEAICLGNGCFPYAPPDVKPKIPLKWLDTHKPDDADPDFPGGHTFALLTIDGSKITIELISESGQTLRTETWQ